MYTVSPLKCNTQTRQIYAEYNKTKMMFFSFFEKTGEYSSKTIIAMACCMCARYVAKAVFISCCNAQVDSLDARFYCVPYSGS